MSNARRRGNLHEAQANVRSQGKAGVNISVVSKTLRRQVAGSDGAPLLLSHRGKRTTKAAAHIPIRRAAAATISSRISRLPRFAPNGSRIRKACRNGRIEILGINS